MSFVSNSLWMLCSSLMNLLGCWPSDCFWSGGVVAFGKWVGVAGVPLPDGAARWFPVIIWGAKADPILAEKQGHRKDGSAPAGEHFLCNIRNITLHQSRIRQISKCLTNLQKSHSRNHPSKLFKHTPEQRFHKCYWSDVFKAIICL